ncbi:MAG: hypothetical protein ACOYN6_05210 [Ignavibacteria bacterium]
MKNLIYNHAFHLLLIIVLFILNVVGFIYYIDTPNPNDSLGGGLDGFGAMFLAFLIFFSLPFIIVFLILMYKLLITIGESLIKSEDKRLCSIVSFSILFGILMIPFLFFVFSVFEIGSKEVIVDWHTNGKKKTGVVYMDKDTTKMVLTKTYYKESGEIEKQEKINGKIKLSFSNSNAMPIFDPSLIVIGKNLTIEEHKLAGFTRFPFPKFPEKAYDINYSLSYIDYPHEHSNLYLDYKLAGVEIFSVKEINTKDTIRRENIYQDYQQLYGDTIEVIYRRERW